jgi:adenine deaminase
MNVKSGKVAQGYNADLILLDANLLEDIENTKTIYFVISNGRLISRQKLDEMLRELKNANDQSRKTNIEQFH